MPHDMVQRHMEEVHRHVDGVEQSDDITMLCLHYKPSQI